jgi:hypothetical protein
MWVTTDSKLVYAPPRPGLKKKNRQTSWMVVAEIDRGITEYYRWWVLKRYGIILQHTAWKPHVTILDGRHAVDKKYHSVWKKYNNVIVPIEYSVEIEQHWKFWILPVKCDLFLDIREELGFSTNFPLHITFGRIDDDN